MSIGCWVPRIGSIDENIKKILWAGIFNRMTESAIYCYFEQILIAKRCCPNSLSDIYGIPLAELQVSWYGDKVIVFPVYGRGNVKFARRLDPNSGYPISNDTVIIANSVMDDVRPSIWNRLRPIFQLNGPKFGQFAKRFQ